VSTLSGMRHTRALLPWIGASIGLLLAVGLLSGGHAVYAGDQPGTPAPGSDAGMGEPGMGEPGMGDAPAPDPDDEDDTPAALAERVGKAITKGVAWLKQHQLSDGSWGNISGGTIYGGGKGEGYGHPAGPTALALYTLLKCKEPVDDPVIKKGFKYLKDRYKLPGGAYETSMMLLAVTATADPFKKFSASAAQGDKVKLSGEMRDWAQQLQKHLLKKRDKFKTMGWRYHCEVPGSTFAIPPGGNEDMSSTQLAALSLLSAERCGIKTESKVWNDILTFTLKQQADDGPEWDRAVYDKAPKKEKAGTAPPPGGNDPDRSRYGPPAGAPAPIKDKARGFAYIKSDKLSPDEGAPTGGMTACGVGNVQMVRYILGKRDESDWRGRDQKGILQAVYDGSAWLDMNWDPYSNPGKKGENVYTIYYMYCVERAFDLIGNNLLGKHPWYQEMAEQLVGKQRDKGFWNSGTTLKPEEVLDTCFALLVLKRSTGGAIPYGSVTQPGDEPPSDNRGK
jgi:hypothetical protein